MNRIPLLLGSLAVLSACSDYDLHRPDKVDPPAPEVEDTGTPPPDPADPDISVSPESIDFGGLAKDCPAEPVPVTISNEGGATLTVSSIELSGTGSSAFSSEAPAVPLSLEPGESITFDVGFTPAAWVEYAIELQVKSDDPDEGKVKVPTLGHGAEDLTYEEGFTQDYYASVDVLWVVDNSGSMDEELQKVRDNFAHFITEFTALGLDYHLAVVTTDMDNPTQSGRIVGTVLSGDDPDVETKFLEYVDVGSMGSGDERGRDAVKAALSDPVLSDENADFLREDAALAVVVVSDEDDSSHTSVASFVSFYSALKADPAMVTFNAIVGDPTTSTDWIGGCQQWVGAAFLSATAGTGYVDVADATGGIWESICTSDYDEALQHLSLTSAGMTVEFPLTYEPSDLSEVGVTVNGSSVGNDATNGWTYDSAGNTVIFHGSAIPGPDEAVVISYPYATECGA